VTLDSLALTVAVAVGLILMIGVAAWWLLIATEGVYLGRRIVIGLYDLYAPRYDAIKNYQPQWEASALAVPLLEKLADVRAPLVLDVATGTARLPLTLFAQPEFDGKIIALDASLRMLKVGAEKVRAVARPDCYLFIHQNAEQLPFATHTFDCVTFLEALEFVSDSRAALRECVRVLKPGGVLLVTRRRRFALMPGRVPSARRMFAKLTALGLTDLKEVMWQVDYEQVWARKPLRAAFPDRV